LLPLDPRGGTLFHVKLDPEAVLSGLDDGQIGQLRAYAGMLAGQGADIGLVSAGDRDRVWDRHVLDSLRALPCLTPENRTLADVGSGGGLPGIPLAVARPMVSVSLIESGGRVAFLERRFRTWAQQHAGRPRGQRTSASGTTCVPRAPSRTRQVRGGWRARFSPGGRMVYFAGRSLRATDLDEMAGEGVISNICRPLSSPARDLVIMQFGS
jgi:hypothetical protein